MQAQIINYRGVSAANLDIDKITLVSGPNGGGKSSICQAVGAALTGEPVPIEGIVKSSAGVLVRSGTAAGSVKLIGTDGITEIAWPSAKVKNSGVAPAASKFAAGLDSIVAMDPKKRIPFLIEYLRAQPTKDDLRKAVAPLNLGWYVRIEDGEMDFPTKTGDLFQATNIEGIPDGEYIPTSGTFEKLWELIQTQGWDATYTQIKDKGARLKGQWEQVANDNYGAKKADTWIPQGWDTNLEGASEDTLRALITDAKDNLEAAIAATAVDDSRRQDLQEVAGKLAERQGALDAAKKPLPEDTALKNAQVDLDHANHIRLGLANALEDLRKTAPRAGQSPKQLVCAHCNGLLMTTAAGQLEKYAVTGPSQQDITAHADKVKKQEQAIAKHDQDNAALVANHKKLTEARQAAIRNWDQTLADATRLVRESMQAQEELNKLGDPVETPAGPSVDECRNVLATQENRLKAYLSKKEADRLHASIVMNQALLAHIAPTGVRADVLTEAIAMFNSVLQQLSGMAGWPVTEITGDFSFTFSGTPYYLLSTAEQFRVRTVIQVAMAVRESAAMIVVDGADILDKPGRNGLFKLLHWSNIPALVGMTIDTEENVPKLAKAGYGRSYWLDASVARELA